MMYAVAFWPPSALLKSLFSPVKTWPMLVVALLAATVVFVLVMAGLHRLPPRTKKWLTIICTFLGGLYFTLEFFWPRHMNPLTHEPENFITPTIEPVSNFLLYTMLWMLGLGIISLSIVHGRRLFRRETGWYNSLAFFISMITVAVVGIWTVDGTAAKVPAAATAVFNSLFFGMLANLDSAMFALLAFYIASAAYRAFRIRTVEAALLMFTALIVMLGLVDIGVTLTSWIPAGSPLAFFRVERLSQFVLLWINMPAYRAVTVGVAVGALAMGLRIWLSLERGAFFSQES